MSEENISWKAGEVIYKTEVTIRLCLSSDQRRVEIISDKGTRVGFINEDEVFGSYQYSYTKRTVTVIALKESKALLIPKNLLDDYNKTSFFIKQF